MGYKVRLTGNYLGVSTPGQVHARLATLLGRDIPRIAALVAAHAEVKHNTDETTARRFKETIEAAGAECALEAVDDPLDIDTEPADLSRAAGERVLFEIEPSARASAGTILLGVAAIALAVAAAVMLADSTLALLALAPAAAGVAMLAGVWIRIKSTRYKLTSERLFARRGLIARKLDEEELYRIQDVSFRQSLWQRIFNVGDVVVVASDPTTPVIVLAGIRCPESVKETLRSAYRRSRRREGVQVGERIIES